MDLGLGGRVAIVAAASQGLGFAAARELAREGARVFLCSRDEGRAAAAAERIKAETGAEVAGLRADVTSDEECARFVSTVRERTGGRIDICVTNAGGSPMSVAAATELEQYRRAFDLNALSAVRLAQLVLPSMREQHWGRIINITSISVKQPIKGMILSNTVRAGLTGWAKTLSMEVAAEGVTVNNVAPGWTLTEKQEEHAVTRGRESGKTKEEMIAGWASEIPSGRLATPEEISGVVAFLASERASYITGVTLQVDGGWTRTLF